MASKRNVIPHPSAPVVEPPIVQDVDLRDGLARLRWPDGSYHAPEPSPGAPTLAAPLATLRDALRRWRGTPPDDAYSFGAVLGLVAVFPGARVDAQGFAQALASIAADERCSPDIVRHVIRHVRATCRTLPSLAEMRDRMLAEMRARNELLTALNRYEADWRERDQRARAEAERIAERAARHGLAVEPGDVIAAWRGLGDGGWVHDREPDDPPRTVAFSADYMLAAIERGHPAAVARMAADLLPRLASYSRERAASLAELRARNVPDDAPEWAAFDAAWPGEESRFAAELGAVADALGLGASPFDAWRE
jgi:hypothetical protein